jgi:formate dehydrogenase major subunit
MTGRTANNELRSSDVLDMSPVDAARLALRDDEVVRVRSRYGSATLPVRITSAVLAGQLFATFQTPDVFINALTGPFRDTWVGTPEYKVTAVHVEAMNHPLM